MHRFGFGSLTWRFAVWISATVGIVYLATLLYSNWISSEMMLESARREAESVTHAEIGEIQKVLRSIEEATQIVGAVIELLDPSEEELRRTLRAFVSGSERIFGSAAAFEPGAFRGGDERFALYYFEGPDGTLRFADLASDSYRFWEKPWYQAPATSGEPSWSAPYLDEEGGETWMVTYSVPVFYSAGDRRVKGVVTADVSLDWLDAQIRDITIGETGYGVILTREGYILSHPNESLMRRTETALEMKDRKRSPEAEAIVKSMMRGESGFEPFDDPYLGVRTRLTYAPIEHAGWSLAILYPEDELFADVRRTLWRQLGLLVLGLAALVSVVVALSRRLTQPIKELAAGAGRIATGDLDTELPEPRSQDEIGALAEAFRNMRDSLKTYIRDLKETTAAKQKLESELQIAHNIQMDMLPKKALGGEGARFEIAAVLEPARHVGGDLYYYVMLDDGHPAFLVGDVSGKGVPAALFMARTKTLFETLARSAKGPGEALSLVNRSLVAENEAGMFVTVFAGVLDPETGELICAAGGHDPPALVPVDGSKPRFLDIEGGPLIGLLDAVTCPTNTIRMKPGDAIVMTTDGVSEARDEADEFFGEERLLQVLEGQSDAPASEITARLLRAVRDFAGGAEQSDDITIMTLRYKG